MVERRIMVVDDDRSLLGFTSKYLARLGYQVTSCSRSDEAWALFSAAGVDFPAVVIDFTLPGLSGARLAHRMLEHNSRTRVVLTSGFHMDPKSLDGTDSTRVAFLHKPFTPAMLVETIDALLGSSHAD
jgi:two-component system cell cycle sensor histidine kinase/response regulator CckA